MAGALAIGFNDCMGSCIAAVRCLSSHVQAIAGKLFCKTCAQFILELGWERLLAQGRTWRLHRPSAFIAWPVRLQIGFNDFMGSCIAAVCRLSSHVQAIAELLHAARHMCQVPSGSDLMVVTQYLTANALQAAAYSCYTQPGTLCQVPSGSDLVVVAQYLTATH